MSEVKRTFMQDLNLWSDANIIGPLGSAASAFEGDQETGSQRFIRSRKPSGRKPWRATKKRPESAAQASRGGCSRAALGPKRAGALSPCPFFVFRSGYRVTSGFGA